MQEAEVQQAKDKLMQERKRLEQLLGRTADHLYRREEPYKEDFAEQAVETQNNEVVEQLDRDSQLEIQLIDKALQRIEQGRYGLCIECGEQISVERLAALPAVELCIDCAVG